MCLILNFILSIPFIIIMIIVLFPPQREGDI